MEMEKITKNILILFFSFFLLIATTYFLNENLIFSQHNKYKDQVIEIKYQGENFSDFDIFEIKKIYTTKKSGFEWFMNNYDPESDPYMHNYKIL